jgi:hypothetical protein
LRKSFPKIALGKWRLWVNTKTKNIFTPILFPKIKYFHIFLYFVGTMFFNLTKSNNTLWRRLIHNRSKKIPVWWHMNTVQSPEMSEFARMLDDEDEAREKVSYIYLNSQINFILSSKNKEILYFAKIIIFLLVRG